MSWPPDAPPRPHVAPARVARRTFEDAKPVARGAALGVIPAVLAVLIALTLRSELPRHALGAFGRDVIALIGGALVYVALVVLVSGFRMSKRMRLDYHAWVEYPTAENAVLNLVLFVPDKIEVCQALCEVTDAAGKTSFCARGVYDAPTTDLPVAYNFPRQFHNASVEPGPRRARWLVQEDRDNDQWIEVFAHSFSYPAPTWGSA